MTLFVERGATLNFKNKDCVYHFNIVRYSKEYLMMADTDFFEHSGFPGGCSPYELLKVNPFASEQEIKEAYTDISEKFKKQSLKRREQGQAHYDLQCAAYTYLTSNYVDSHGQTQKQHYDLLYRPNLKPEAAIRKGRPPLKHSIKQERAEEGGEEQKEKSSSSS